MSQDRLIYCNKCGGYLGVIRDAKLKKGMTFSCGVCPTAEAKPREKFSKTGDFAIDDLLKMFGMSK